MCDYHVRLLNDVFRKRIIFRRALLVKVLLHARADIAYYKFMVEPKA